MHTLILTAAGKSTRFKKPKWALTHPSGNLMMAEALRGTTCYDQLVVAMNTDDLRSFGVENIQRELELVGYSPIIVDVGNTKTQTASVHRALYAADVSGPFTVRECDNAFTYKCENVTGVAVVDLQTYDKPVIAKNKSYVKLGNPGKCVEKVVLSRYFCCGAYSFESVYLWDTTYTPERHTYISQVMDQLSFDVCVAHDYVDWGTQEDWDRYCADFKTLFIDIDGVLVESSHRSFHPRWGESDLIQENVDAINSLQNAYVVLTTSRQETHREVTEQQLQSVRYDQLLMGLPVCRRILINDRTDHDTASAVNLIRNAKELSKFL